MEKNISSDNEKSTKEKAQRTTVHNITKTISTDKRKKKIESSNNYNTSVPLFSTKIILQLS